VTLLVLSAFLLSACAVGPDYVRPQPAAPAQFERADAATETTEPVAEFWQRFEDPVLTRLVQESLVANHDLRGALARVEQAFALARLQGYDRLPTVTAEGGYTESQTSADQAPGVPAQALETEIYDAGAVAFWELDLFGRVRRSIESSRAEAAAAEADLRALQVSIAAEVARSYFELRGHQEQLRIAQDNAANQRETLNLTELRLKAGRGTEFDTARARAQLESTLSRIPALEADIAATIHRLAVLNGRQPGELRAELEASQPLPVLPATVAVGTPAELLRRRPDIQAAERRLAAATARIGVATADLFPRVTINGAYGSAADSLGDLFSSSTETFAFGPSISWAFLDLGRVRSRIAASDAATDAQLAAYEGTVLRALEEAESALVRYRKTRDESGHLKDAAEASTKAAQMARLRFDAGAADFLQVLDAERSLLSAEDQLAESRTRATTALVAVYRSVAGGWPERAPQSLTARKSDDDSGDDILEASNLSRNTATKKES